jgi:hypothetical protein
VLTAVMPPELAAERRRIAVLGIICKRMVENENK